MAVVRSVGQVGGGDQGELRRFRGEVYDCLDRRADALFDLVDGICAPVTVAGVAYLSLAPGARRGHGAGYAAVSAGRIDEDLLRDVMAGYGPEGWRPDSRLMRRVWARSDAECSPGRGFHYHPSRHSARAADRGGLVLLVAGRAVSGSRLVDSAAGLMPAGRRGQSEPGRRAAGARGVGPAARGADRGGVRVRRRL